MITDEDVEKSIDFLQTSALKTAQAKANRIYLDEYRKSLKAMIMKEHQELPVSAQEREAYSDARYLNHLKAIRQAVQLDEQFRFERVHHEAKIEAWRSHSANMRAIKI
tara:strand:- start:5001 stop:5324 length:324 start_codon:yes stop_codon:yes gene_type:complete